MPPIHPLCSSTLFIASPSNEQIRSSYVQLASAFFQSFIWSSDIVLSLPRYSREASVYKRANAAPINHPPPRVHQHHRRDDSSSLAIGLTIGLSLLFIMLLFLSYLSCWSSDAVRRRKKQKKKGKCEKCGYKHLNKKELKRCEAEWRHNKGRRNSRNVCEPDYGVGNTHRTYWHRPSGQNDRDCGDCHDDRECWHHPRPRFHDPPPIGRKGSHHRHHRHGHHTKRKASSPHHKKDAQRKFKALLRDLNTVQRPVRLVQPQQARPATGFVIPAAGPAYYQPQMAAAAGGLRPPNDMDAPQDDVAIIDAAAGPAYIQQGQPPPIIVDGGEEEEEEEAFDRALSRMGKMAPRRGRRRDRRRRRERSWERRRRQHRGIH